MATGSHPQQGALVGGLPYSDAYFADGGIDVDGVAPFAVTGAGEVFVCTKGAEGEGVVLAGEEYGVGTFPIAAVGWGSHGQVALAVSVVSGSGGGGSVPVIDAATGATGAAVPADAMYMGASDGTDLRGLLVDGNGYLKVNVETGTVAVTNAGLTALNSALATAGAAKPADILQVGGSDGTYLRAMSVNSSGYLQVEEYGFDHTYGAVGGAPNGNVLPAGAWDGTNLQYLTVDGSGYLEVNVKAGGSGGGAVYGPTAAGSAPANPPVLTGGTDGTDVRTFLTDTSGQQKVLVENSVAVTGTFYQSTQPISGTVTAVGDAASGSAVAGNPVLMGGSDGTDARTLLTDTGGQLKVLVENTSLAVTGTFYQATQPVSIASSVAVTGTFYQATQPVSGTVAVTNAGLTSLGSSIQAIGSAIPADVVMVGASDGTDSRALLVDGSGYLKVNVEAIGSVAVTNAGLTALNSSIQAVGSAIPADTVMVGASDGTDSRNLLVDASGYLKVNVAAGGAGGGAVYGPTAAGSAPANPPVLVAGSDATDIRTFLTDTGGRLVTTSTPSALQATAAESITSTVTSLSNTAGISGQCVAVTIKNIDTGQMAYNCSVRVRDTTNGMTGNWQSCGLLWNTAYATLFFNMPIVKGDTVIIDVIAPGSLTASKTDVTGYILLNATPTDLRPDGRGLPLHSQMVLVGYGAGAAQAFISAPPSGFRILLCGTGLNNQVATVAAAAQMNVTVNGSTSELPLTYDSGQAGANAATVWPAGFLCDPATAVTVGVGTGGTAVASATYDIVPI
jgi:hypothetical protein